MNVELQQLCKCADIYFRNACFWSGTKPLLPRRETDCVKWTQPPASLFYPAVFFPCSPSPVLAFLFHPPPSLPLPITPICPLTLPRSSTRSPVSSDRVGRWQQRFKRLLLKTLHESVSSDSEVSDKTCNDIPPILSLSQQSSYGWHIVSCNYSIMTFLPRSSLPAEHASAVVPTALLVDSHWILIRWFH